MRFPILISALLAAIYPYAAVRGQTLVDVVVETDILSTLEAAVVQADLVETLNSTGPFTYVCKNTISLEFIRLCIHLLQ